MLGGGGTGRRGGSESESRGEDVEGGDRMKRWTLWVGSVEFHWRKCSVVGAVGAEVWLVQVGGEVNVGYGQESNQVFNTLIKSISNVLNTI